jgi:hypothetical protein
VFTPHGSFVPETEDLGKVDASKYQPVIPIALGNFETCAVCNEGVDLVLCGRCPRGYHAKCLTGDGFTGEITQPWTCHRCTADKEIGPDDELSGLDSSDVKIKAAYQHLEEYAYNAQLLQALLEIINKLTEYDFGNIFAVPGESTVRLCLVYNVLHALTIVCNVFPITLRSGHRRFTGLP